ncbi:hypothetical protein GCM10023156_10770 [Novipirellula rosea]|uniref:Uncharacterized protein n=1 Tax=Novipirellula rosea TaxID=1031540 RepID=A0ABP8MBV8_9BACT
MNTIRDISLLHAVMVIGAILVVVGWTVDYFSSGDPHFWDSLGFVTIAAAVVAMLYRRWRASSDRRSASPVTVR